MILELIILSIVIYIVIFPYPKMKSDIKKHDCVIVLGYPANDDGSISDILKSRTDTAIELYHSGVVDKLILSGGSVQNQYNEAETMWHYALENGVNHEDIFLEKQSRSTYHNLLYCKDIMGEHHFKTCLVVTNSWHLRKANHYVQKQKLNYTMFCATQPPQFSKTYICYMHIQIHITTFVQFLKGYY